MRSQNLVLCVVVGALIALPGGAAFAGVTITAEEVGGDVVFSGGGTLDTSQWTFFGTGPTEPFVDPEFAMVVGAAGNIDAYTEGLGFSGPPNIGPGTTLFFADSGDGDLFALDWFLDGGALGVPTGYLSGDPLGPSTATYIGHTFASLGVKEGVYTWTWDTADGQGDFFTINIIPAPGAFSLLGVAGVVCRRRRRA